MEITTESPLLPWLVRQCDVVGEVGQKRTAPDLVLWGDEHGGLLEPAQKGEERAFQLVQIQRRRPRTSSRTSFRTAAATACEPEMLTIHITDNHTKSLEQDAGTARKRQAHFRSTEARGVREEHCARAAGPPPNKFSVMIAYL